MSKKLEGKIAFTTRVGLAAARQFADATHETKARIERRQKPSYTLQRASVSILNHSLVSLA
jgi:hypothetical protein